jgi:hypothetical protein
MYQKTMCKPIRSTPDPTTIEFYQEYKLTKLLLWVTTWLSHGQTAPRQLFTDAMELEYAAKDCCLEGANKDYDKD